MRKCFLILVLILFFAVPVSAKIITGGVEVSVEQAREEIFSNSTPNLDFGLIRAKFFDNNRLENTTTLLKGITELKDRTLAKFSDGSYGVIYKDNPTDVFYYSSDGVLIYYDKKTSLTFPYKTYKYTPLGKLVNTSLRVSDEESFIFEKSGKLLAHWVGENCYDENNNIIMTREFLK
ncbi:hypothetical protein J6A64_04110 [bacterium]|nr:hypothetical protein [bacterium]MBO5446427.1 hypothetical protein [bacterium]